MGGRAGGWGGALDACLPASFSACLPALSLLAYDSCRPPAPHRLYCPVLPAGGCLKYTDKWAERDVGLGGKDEWGDKWEETFKNGSGNKKVSVDQRGWVGGWVAGGKGCLVWGFDAADCVCASEGHARRPVDCLPACPLLPVRRCLPAHPPAARLLLPAGRDVEHLCRRRALQPVLGGEPHGQWVRAEVWPQQHR